MTMMQGADSVGLSARADGRGRRRRVGVTAAAGCLVGLLVLVGCAGGDQEPVPTPVVTPDEPTATPDPEPLTAPVRPESWWETDEAAAVDAAEYFLALYDYSTRSGDLAEWIQVSGETCGFCASVNAGVEHDFAEGGGIVGGELTVTDVDAVAYDEIIAVHGVQAQFDHEAATRVDGDGAAVAEYERETGYIVLDVAASVRGWVLMEGSLQDGPVE